MNKSNDADQEGVHQVVKSNQPTDLLAHWTNAALCQANAHFMAANKCKRKNLFLGVPAIIFSTIVGTSVFATLEKDVDLGWRIIAGIVSVLAAVFSVLQTALKFDDRAASHRSAATGYGSVHRHMEEILLCTEEQPDIKVVSQIRERLDSLESNAPTVPSAVWKAATEEIPIKGLSFEKPIS